MNMNRIWVFSGLVVLSTGCATVAPPNEKLASSQAAIRGAEEVGARGVPQAALHLKLAQEQVDQAKVMMREGETERAGLVLSRAQVDAELALALARENGERRQAQQAIQQVQSLSQQSR
jgi:hypothetical protein